MKNVFLLLITIAMLTACSEEKKDAVVSKSPNGNIILSVSGKRESSISGWKTELKAEGSGLKGNILFEFFAKELTEKTIQFAWEGNEKCTVTFLQKDDTKRIYEFTPNSMEHMWLDVSPK